MTQAHTPSLFKTLLLLTFFLVSLQILMVIAKVSSPGVTSITLAKSLFLQLIAAPAVWQPVLIFLVTQLLLQLGFTCFIWMMARTIGARYAMKAASTYTLGITLWLIYVVLIFVVNTLAFNHSLFALFSVSQVSTSRLYLCYASLLLLPMILAFTRSWRPAFVLVMLFSLCYLLIEFQQSYLAPPKTTMASKPSIIIISVEALRPEYVSDMPFMSSLLKSSVQFTDAYTPIAQSFPSWISILTSRTPLHQGARSLYTDYANIDLRGSLLTKLHDAGYQRVYAVDGQRFGEITPAIGFDKIISPPYGAAELLIGSISDFPLSNLVTLTRLGNYLFPYHYANRSIAVTYQPQDYIDLLQTNLRALPNQPLFMVVHFSLSHWPYRWAQDNEPAHESMLEAYQRSLRVTDQQIKAFYQSLEKNKLLDHAIVIMISDHGIGLGLPGDSFGDEKKYIGNRSRFPTLIKNPYSTNQQSGYDTSYNYSTNIMSLQQYHTLLALKFYGLPAPANKMISTRTSLMDIAPTITSLLKLPAEKNWDGQSLFSAEPHRAFFIENGFTTPAITKANIDINRVFQSAVQWVQMDSAGLLSLTAVAQRTLLAKKERALLLDDWLLARLNAKDWVLINIKNGKWTADFSSSFARSAPLVMMMKKFNAYNAGEV